MYAVIGTVADSINKKSTNKRDESIDFIGNARGNFFLNVSFIVARAHTQTHKRTFVDGGKYAVFFLFVCFFFLQLFFSSLHNMYKNK